MNILNIFRYRRKGKFEKVPLIDFQKDYIKCMNIDVTKMTSEERRDFFNRLQEIWQNIVLPVRKTQDAMGHDFTVPFEFELKPGENITIPTGIRCKLSRGWGLLLSVRSGCGKYRIQLDDTIPAIDGDFYMCPRNGGDIIISLTNDNRDGITVKFNKDTSFIQGFIMPYAVDVNDWKVEKQVRRGGFGSTGNQNNTKKDMS